MGKELSLTSITVILPIRTVSEANVREHWAVKAKRAKAQRDAAFLMLRRYRRTFSGTKLHVILTRIGKRELDSDNLARSFKAVRDGIADAFGTDDGADRWTWEYRQEKGEYSVRVDVKGGGKQ